MRSGGSEVDTHGTKRRRTSTMKKTAKNAKRPVTNVKRPAKGTVNNGKAKKRGAK